MQSENIRNIVTHLNKGNIIALPTDTIIGLAADPANKNAYKKLYAVKQRSLEKQIVWMVKDVSSCMKIADIPDYILPALNKFWPGPLTIISKIKSSTNTIGLRIPNYKPLLSLLKQWDKPLGVTSANISGEKPINNFEELKKKFGGRIDYYWDINAISSGKASTIIDVTGDTFKIIREGDITINQLKSSSKSSSSA
jgi:L-threonylcarbamoyladenylate synthase